MVRAARVTRTGTGIPGVVALCTLRGRGFRDFAAVYRKGPAVVIEADGAEFNRVTVSCADAAAEARRIEEALAAARPSG